jgi:hypothetical protein
VTSFQVGSDGSAWALNGGLYYYRYGQFAGGIANGNWVPSAINITAFALDPRNGVYALDTSGNLRYAPAGDGIPFTQIDSHVAAFIIDSSGKIQITYFSAPTAPPANDNGQLTSVLPNPSVPDVIPPTIDLTGQSPAVPAALPSSGVSSQGQVGSVAQPTRSGTSQPQTGVGRPKRRGNPQRQGQPGARLTRHHR